MNTPNAYAPPKANVADVSPGDELVLASRLARLGAHLLDGIIVSAFFWLRNVVNLLISTIPFVGWIYAIVDVLFIFSENKQCLHDKIAGTIVVNA
jgi:uncharacterized RDD family membrane protein YckC